MTTITNDKIIALRNKAATVHSILDDVCPMTEPFTLMTAEVREKVNHLFGELNEIERQIEAEYRVLNNAIRPIWKRILKK